jgi:hypothetical protein
MRAAAPTLSGSPGFVTYGGGGCGIDGSRTETTVITYDLQGNLADLAFTYLVIGPNQPPAGALAARTSGPLAIPAAQLP